LTHQQNITSSFLLKSKNAQEKACAETFNNAQSFYKTRLKDNRVF